MNFLFSCFLNFLLGISGRKVWTFWLKIEKMFFFSFYRKHIVRELIMKVFFFWYFNVHVCLYLEKLLNSRGLWPILLSSDFYFKSHVLHLDPNCASALPWCICIGFSYSTRLTSSIQGYFFKFLINYFLHWTSSLCVFLNCCVGY